MEYISHNYKWSSVYLKTNYSYFSETLSKIRDLVPYFEMDYLLPRSLMSCIRIDQISVIIKDNQIPSDVIIATLYFYIRSKTSDGEIEVSILHHVLQ